MAGGTYFRCRDKPFRDFQRNRSAADWARWAKCPTGPGCHWTHEERGPFGLWPAPSMDAPCTPLWASGLSGLWLLAFAASLPGTSIHSSSPFPRSLRPCHSLDLPIHPTSHIRFPAILRIRCFLLSPFNAPFFIPLIRDCGRDCLAIRVCMFLLHSPLPKHPFRYPLAFLTSSRLAAPRSLPLPPL